MNTLLNLLYGLDLIHDYRNMCCFFELIVSAEIQNKINECKTK